MPKISLTYAAGASLLLVMAGCSGGGDAPADPDAPERAVPVEVAVVGGGAPVAGDRISGTVRARREGAVGFSVPGVIASIAVNEGDRVRRGQVLAALDTREVSAGVGAAQAEVARAEAELARTRDLFGKGWVPKARLDSAEAAAAAARAQRESRGYALRYARITAPSDGVVLARLAEPGQIVGAGAPVLNVSQTGGGYVLQVALTDRQVVGLRAGQGVPVQIPALGDAPVIARVVQIAGRADDRTGTFRADLSLPGNAALRSGMIGEARLPASGAGGGGDTASGAALAVPASAVWQARADQGFVFVVDDKARARAQRVTLGRVTDRDVAVLDGLTAGQRVIVGGLSQVREGFLVKPVARGAVAAAKPASPAKPAEPRP